MNRRRAAAGWTRRSRRRERACSAVDGKERLGPRCPPTAQLFFLCMCMCVRRGLKRAAPKPAPLPPSQKNKQKKRLPISYVVPSRLSTLYAHQKRLVISYRDIAQGLTCTVYTAKVPGRRDKVIAKVARRRNKGRLEDQVEVEFNVLRQASYAARIACEGSRMFSFSFSFSVNRYLSLIFLLEKCMP